jgi:hypothetical protein
LKTKENWFSLGPKMSFIVHSYVGIISASLMSIHSFIRSRQHS